MPDSSVASRSAAPASVSSPRLAVAAELEPAAALAVQRQQHPLAGVVEHERARGEVGRDAARADRRRRGSARYSRYAARSSPARVVRARPSGSSASRTSASGVQGRAVDGGRAVRAVATVSSRPDRSSGAEPPVHEAVGSSRSSAVGSRSGCAHRRPGRRCRGRRRARPTARRRRAAGAAAAPDRPAWRTSARPGRRAARRRRTVSRSAPAAGSARLAAASHDRVDPALDQRERGLQPGQRGLLLGGVLGLEHARRQRLLQRLGVAAGRAGRPPPRAARCRPLMPRA